MMCGLVDMTLRDVVARVYISARCISGVFFVNGTATTEIYTSRSSAASDVYKRQEIDLAGVDRVDAGKNLHQRRLAGAVLSDQPCLLYTSPSPRDSTRSRMPSSA